MPQPPPRWLRPIEARRTVGLWERNRNNRRRRRSRRAYFSGLMVIETRSDQRRPLCLTARCRLLFSASWRPSTRLCGPKKRLCPPASGACQDDAFVGSSRRRLMPAGGYHNHHRVWRPTWGRTPFAAAFCWRHMSRASSSSPAFYFHPCLRRCLYTAACFGLMPFV